MARRNKLCFSGDNDTSFNDLITAQYTANFIEHSDEKNHYISKLKQIPWERVEYTMYGKPRSTPRMTWCFGRINDEIVKYRGKSFQTESMPDWLMTLRDKVQEKTGFNPNAAILNYYPTIYDHINWHADDEKFLAEKTIASISLQGERIFSMRNLEYRFDITLRSGSLLMMYNGIEHCLEEQAMVRPRFNITFRKLNDEKGVGNYYYYNRGIKYALK